MDKVAQLKQWLDNRIDKAHDRMNYWRERLNEKGGEV